MSKKNYCLVRAMKDLTSDPFKFMLCLNFEATCWDKNLKLPAGKKYKQEIIEFPVLLLNLANGEIVDEFHEYVRPTEHPTLTDYCVWLTGITQEVADAGTLLPECLSKFTAWLKCATHRFNLVLPKTDCNDMSGNVAICAWNQWQTHCINKECKRKELPMPSCFGQWVNANPIFFFHYNIMGEYNNFRFRDALKHVGLEFQERPHTGLDSAKNLARLVYRMRQDGVVLKITKDYFPNLQVNEPFCK